LEWQINEYELSAEYIAKAVERPESRAIELVPRKWQLPPELLLNERPTLTHERHIDENILSPGCSTDVVESPECSVVVGKSSSKSKHSHAGSEGPAET